MIHINHDIMIHDRIGSRSYEDPNHSLDHRHRLAGLCRLDLPTVQPLVPGQRRRRLVRFCAGRAIPRPDNTPI